MQCTGSDPVDPNCLHYCLAYTVWMQPATLEAFAAIAIVRWGQDSDRQSAALTLIGSPRSLLIGLGSLVVPRLSVLPTMLLAGEPLRVFLLAKNARADRVKPTQKIQTRKSLKSLDATPLSIDVDRQ
jgi:hypothetical protein